MTANNWVSDEQAREMVQQVRADRREPEWLTKPRTASEVQARALRLGFPADDEDNDA